MTTLVRLHHAYLDINLRVAHVLHVLLALILPVVQLRPVLAARPIPIPQQVLPVVPLVHQVPTQMPVLRHATNVQRLLSVLNLREPTA